MKKITLFAAIAALTASSAIAAMPQQAVKVTPETKLSDLSSFRKEVGVKSNLSVNNQIEVTEEGNDQVSIDASAFYVPSQNSFYLGQAPYKYSVYTVPVAFTGIRNKIGFQNLTFGADSFSWTYGQVTGLNDEMTDYNYDWIESNEANCMMELLPYQRFSFPVLSATFGTDEVSYSPSTSPLSLYHCGGSPLYWGYSIAEEPSSWDDIFGVWPCTATLASGGYLTASRFSSFSVKRPDASDYDATRFDENGTSTNWYKYNNNNQAMEDIIVKGFATQIPAMPSAYQMSAMWAWLNNVETKAAMTLPVKVYAVVDGEIDYVNHIGEGELVLNEGANVFENMPVIELFGVVDGWANTYPVMVPAGQSIVVAIEGLDNPDLLNFEILASAATVFEESMWDYYNILYPNHALTIVDCKYAPKVDGATNGELVETRLELIEPNIYIGDTETQYIVASDLYMFFDVNFPAVINLDEASADYYTANFNVEVPVEGGEVVVPVYCDYIMDSLIEEGTITATASEWITFSQAFDETQQITNVTISAAALPEGETGRTGYVVYEGFAIDFYITVTQGEASGIDNIVVTPVAKGTKFYDLQGRQLQAAPAAGMYIESVDGKATKRLAR